MPGMKKKGMPYRVGGRVSKYAEGGKISDRSALKGQRENSRQRLDALHTNPRGLGLGVDQSPIPIRPRRMFSIDPQQHPLAQRDREIHRRRQESEDRINREIQREVDRLANIEAKLEGNEDNMPGMKKYQEGGAVRGRRRGPSYEEDMTPPRGMRGFRPNMEPSDEPMPGRRERRGFEEDMTPPRGMRGFNPQMVPTDEPPPGRPQRYQAGGMVTHMGPGVGGAPPSPNVPSMGRRVVRPGPGAMPAPGMVRPPVANPGRPMPRPPVMQPGPGGGLMGGGGRPMPMPKPQPGGGALARPLVIDREPTFDSSGRTTGFKPIGPGAMPFKKGGKIAAKAPVKKAAGGKVAAKTPAMKEKGGVVKKAKGGMVGRGCK